MHHLIDKKLLIASHNTGKVREFGELLKPYEIKCISAKSLNLPEPEENGQTFEENAKIKALSACMLSKQVSLSDDSGLCVNALGGKPGIYSARWAGPDRDFLKAAQKIKEELYEKNDYSAKFVCALTLAWPDMHCEIFVGEIYGKLTFPPKGNKGFGYDPIFIPTGYNETFGQMDPRKKETMSHRSVAFNKLIKAHLS